jgi:hypothetical protein
MRSVSSFAFYLSCSLVAFLLAATASATTMTYKWSDIDCRQSRIATWPGLKCETTNVVTTEGNIGAFRKWSTYGVSSEGYVHVFLWEAQNSFSYLSTDEITADFLKWVHVNGSSPLNFRRSPVITMSTTRLSETTNSNGTVQVFAVPEMSGEEDMTGSWAAYYVLHPERT